MKRFFISSIMACLQFLTVSCIHTQSTETRAIQSSNENALFREVNNGLELQYMVYRSSQLPLSDFFYHLKNGDYNEAFKKIDLRYRPANYKDEALTELIDAGFVPVYVRIQNGTGAPIEIDEKTFFLGNSKSSTQAFYSGQLPREFKHFSPKAVAANVYNTTVVIAGFAALMAVLVATNSNGFPDLSGLSAPSSESAQMYNDIQSTVRVDYRNYLITKTTLKPGEQVKGLLFFNLGSSNLPPDLRLSAHP